MSTKKPASITLLASQFRDLIVDLVPFADTAAYGSTAVLGAVNLTARGKWLVATATDRYAIGMKRAEISAPARLNVNIPTKTIRQISATFKPVRTVDPQFTLTFKGSTLTVQASGGLSGMESASIDYPMEAAEYPKVAAIFDEMADLSPIAVTSINPGLLAKFAKVQRVGERMTLHGTAKHSTTGRPRPIFVTIADDFLGAVQPLTPVSDVANALPSWTDLLKPSPAAKKAVA